MLSIHEQIKNELARYKCEIRVKLSGPHPQVEGILLYIHEHLFDSGLSVKVIKSRCEIRNNNITTQFRCTVGVGLREYIEGHRLEAAARLLLTGALPVYIVAMSVGYSYHETFCRAFVRRFGYSPSSHKLGVQEGLEDLEGQADKAEIKSRGMLKSDSSDCSTLVMQLATDAHRCRDPLKGVSMKKKQLERISEGIFADLTIEQKKRVAGGVLSFKERTDGYVEVKVD
jgi:AraC-like DNA-binding protein